MCYVLWCSKCIVGVHSVHVGVHYVRALWVYGIVRTCDIVGIQCMYPVSPMHCDTIIQYAILWNEYIVFEQWLNSCSTHILLNVLHRTITCSVLPTDVM